MDRTPLISEYARVSRDLPGQRWWKPLLTLVLAVFSYALIVVLALVLVARLVPGGDIQVNRVLVGTMSFNSDPVTVAVIMGTIIAFIPAVVLAISIVERRSLGTLSSVAGRLRWKRILACLPVALVAFLVQIVLTGMEVAASGAADRIVRYLPAILVGLVLVPVQSAAEEYLFRGLIVQEVGVWVPSAWVAVLVQVPLFTLLHGYHWTGAVVVALIALVAGWLTLRTGGLEAGIVLHAVNNLVALFPSFLGIEDVSEGVVSPLGILVVAAVLALYVAGVEVVGRRAGWFTPAALRGEPEPVETPAVEFTSAGVLGMGAGAVSTAEGEVVRVPVLAELRGSEGEDAEDEAVAPAVPEGEELDATAAGSLSPWAEDGAVEPLDADVSPAGDGGGTVIEDGTGVATSAAEVPAPDAGTAARAESTPADPVPAEVPAPSVGAAEDAAPLESEPAGPADESAEGLPTRAEVHATASTTRIPRICPEGAEGTPEPEGAAAGTSDTADTAGGRAGGGHRGEDDERHTPVTGESLFWKNLDH